MAFSHGKDCDIGFGTHAVPGTATDITAYVTSVTMPREIDTAETSCMGDTDKSFLAGLKGANISIEGKFDPTVDAHLDGIAGDDGIIFEYYPQGNSAGKVKYTGSCILTSYEVSESVDDAGSFSAEFQISGAVTRSLVGA